MRTIERSSQFKRDFKRVISRGNAAKVERSLLDALDYLVNNRELPAKFQDHALVGQFAGFRDCHLAFDLVLLYHFPDTETLRLVRLGSHSDLQLN